MKRKLSLLLAVLILTLSVGCGQAQQPAQSDSGSAPKTEDPAPTGDSAEKIRIGMTVYSFGDIYCQTLRNGAEKFAAEHSDVELTILDGKIDVSNQLGQVENFCTQGYDAIVIQAVDSSTGKTLLDTCNKAGVLLVGLDRPFDGYEDATAYSGSTAYDQGKAQAEYMVEVLGGKGNVAVLQGTAGEPNQVDRTQAYYDVFADYPDIKIVAEGDAKWDRTQGMELMENFLQMGTEIDAVLSNNDEMAIGALNAIKDAGKQDILVAGIDASADACAAVLAGDMTCTVNTDPAGQAYVAVEMAYKAAKGETLDNPINWMTPSIVTAENAQELIG